MAEQASSGTVAGPGDTGDTGDGGLDAEVGVQFGPAHTPDAHHGRRSSWVAVSIIIVGFVVGGIAMVPHPKWWLVWVGTGIVVLGAIMATATRIFDDWY
ncbi:MAG: HGxxPAAW family protein [Streptosporangiaceae bacterium]